MSTIYSNTFTSIIARESTPGDEEVIIYSDKFTCTVTRVEIQETDKNTKVVVYKGTNELIPVKDTPSVGQYKVDIIDVLNCTHFITSLFLKFCSSTIIISSLHTNTT